MARASTRMVKFVRALVDGAVAGGSPETGWTVAAFGSQLQVSGEEAAGLVHSGVLESDGGGLRARPEAAAWTRRALLPEDAHGSQHRETVALSGGAVLNLLESPLLRLSRPQAGEAHAFLNAAQVETGERVRQLCERAQLGPRLTMSYSPAHTATGGGRAGAAGEIGDMAADARRALGEMMRSLPPDCAGVVLDVCGFLKGLQQVESERGWPRRSAKLVLRIGLDQLARIWGIGVEAVGPDSRRVRRWMGEGARPEEWG